MWMDPLDAINYLHQIQDSLTKADPIGKDVYAQNADAYITKLRTLDQWVKGQVNAYLYRYD